METRYSSSSSMEVAITLIDKPREDSAVEDFDRETPRNCNLETIFSNGSDACRVEASTREAYACDGVEGDAAPLCPKSSKGTRQEISFSKTSLGKEERSRGPNIIKPDEMNRLQKMLSQANRLTPCFPERRLYHPSSHFIGRDSPLLQRSPSAALRLRLPASSSRGQLKSNYRSPVFPARKHHKNVKRKEAMASRPPLPIDKDEPGPKSYSPTSEPPPAPSTSTFSFSGKTPNTEGGSQTSRDKAQSTDPSARKTIFEAKWPTAFHYTQRSKLRPQQITKLSYPSYTIRQQIDNYVFATDKAYPVQPRPTYNIVLADRLVLQNSAAYSMGQRLQGIWQRTGSSPGPCTYDVDRAGPITSHRCPSYTIRGMRKEKRHDLGPFTTL
ncbi:large ribosomal subunit protein mL41 isoform X2 [Heptranchias perlo]|uniref:large ribosomal subunit protein mL41 isoform X2 n=1 Tax=Heptranchias perlo TaxID=212740 RepID=UPI00355AA3D5